MLSNEELDAIRTVHIANGALLSRYRLQDLLSHIDEQAAEITRLRAKLAESQRSEKALIDRVAKAEKTASSVTTLQNELGGIVLKWADKKCSLLRDPAFLDVLLDTHLDARAKRVVQAEKENEHMRAQLRTRRRNYVEQGA